MPIGYADHTEGEDPFANIVDLVALGMGAMVLEKHLTPDRSVKGVDYQAALEPAEFKTYVKNMHRGHLAIGSKEIRPFNASDLKYRKFQKKSIVAKRLINKGESISMENTISLRNENPGIAPIDFPKVEDKKAKYDIQAFENITLENTI